MNNLVIIIQEATLKINMVKSAQAVYDMEIRKKGEGANE